jgi:DNA-binding MarR family transcriptional regulator
MSDDARHHVPVEEWPLSALLRAARSVSGARIRKALEESDYDDLPANGPYVLGAISRTGVQLAAVISQLGVSKQAAGQLVDSLVVRGYLDRRVDPDDRRRLIVTLTERGEAAARVIRETAGELEAALIDRAGADNVRTARQTLATLITTGLG